MGRLKREAHICPFLRRKANKIHDYQIQRIKYLKAFGKPMVVILQNRRYYCDCGKHFFDKEDPDNQKAMVKEWIEYASNSEIQPFVKCADTYRTWFSPTIDKESKNTVAPFLKRKRQYLVNSFDCFCKEQGLFSSILHTVQQ